MQQLDSQEKNSVTQAHSAVGPAETKTEKQKLLVGRGVADGARLLHQDFNDTSELAKRGESAAYCFVAGNLIEVLRTFDIPVTYPETNSVQTVFRNASLSYLEEAEDYGYSPDICGFLKIGVAIQNRGGEHPSGLIPKPRLAILNNYCNTYIKWGEIWERTYDCPVVSLDYPMNRSAGSSPAVGSEQFNFEKKYLRGQIEEAIEVCERITGKRFDIDKFRQILQWSNDVTRGWQRVMELNKNQPALFNVLTDGAVYVGVASALRGTAEGSKYFADLVEELEYRAEHGIGAFEKSANGVIPTKQEFRLALIGTACYPIFRQFNEMFAKWGGMFVYSSYLDIVTVGAQTGYQYDIDDPLDSYAAGQLIMHCFATDSMFHAPAHLATIGPKYGLDGVVFHPIKSCRTCSTGMADTRRIVSVEQGLATLFIESDHVDPRVVAEAPMRNRVDAFFEGLVSRRQQQRASMT